MRLRVARKVTRPGNGGVYRSATITRALDRVGASMMLALRILKRLRPPV